MTTVRFNSITLTRALGIRRDEGFKIEKLSPQINIVHGPNGTGKSTLSRVIQKLLWSQHRDVEAALNGATVSGLLGVVDGASERSWSIDIDSGHATSTLDGHTGFPSFSGERFHARYQMRIDELLVEGDEQFANEMARQAVGGFDIARAAETLGFQENPTKPRAARTKCVEAQTRVDQCRKTQSQLSDEQQELARKKFELDGMRNARKQIADLERAKVWIDASAELQAAQANVDVYGVEISSLTGNELRSIEAVDDQLRTIDVEKHQRTEELDECTDDMRAMSVAQAERGVRIEVLSTLVSALELADGNRANAKRALDSAMSRRNAAALEVFGRIEIETLPTLDIAMLESTKSLWERGIGLSHSKELVTELRRVVREFRPPIEGLPESVVLTRGIVALASWLKATGSKSVAPEFSSSAMWITCAVVALLAVVLAVLDGLAWLSAALAAGLVASVVTSTNGRDTVGAGIDEPALRKKDYLDLGLREISDWSSDVVAREIDHLFKLIEQVRSADSEKLQRETLQRREGELQDQVCQFDADCALLTQQCGVRPTDHAGWITVLANSISAWQKANQDHDASSTEHEGLVGVCSDLLDQIIQSLPSIDDAVVRNGIEAEARLAELRGRRENLESLDRRRNELSRDCASIEKRREDVEATRKGFWKEIGLTVGDRASLADRMRQYDQFATARDQLRVATLSLETAKRGLGGARQHITLERAQIVSRIHDASAGEVQENALRDEVAAIEARVKAAMEGSDLTLALEEQANCNETLRALEETAARSVIGNALVKWIRAQSREEHAPKVIKRAQELLTIFTVGRLEFDLDETDETPSFRARNGENDSWRPVSELSSGERVQLLMAVRLAFIEENESCALPLLLDEVLGTSDDVRAEQIIDTVVEIARGGRQVFYFTAQADEVEKWSRRLDGSRSGAAFVEAEFVDLGVIRRMTAVQVRPTPEAPPPRVPIASPGVMSHHQYGQALGVPNFDPWDIDATNCHIWHVIEDTLLLETLLNADVERWGQLQRLVRDTDFQGLGDQRKAIYATAKAITAACRVWQHGRGKKIDRTVLMDSGAVSGVFIDCVSALAATHDGDAARLIHVLNSGVLPGWRRGNTTTLVDFFTENGWIGDGERLDHQGIRDEMILALTTSGSLDIVSPTTRDRILKSLPT